jgi:uncharacterized membrane protein YqjE
MDGLGMLIFMGGVVTLIFAIIGIALYVLLAIGLYGLAKTENTGNEWFAFIPILQLYIIGKILGQVNIGGYTVPMLEIVFPLAPIAVSIVGGILGIIPVLGGLVQLLLNIALFVLSVVVIFNFYKRYRGEQAMLMTVLSIILPFMGPIYIFKLKDARPL